MKKIILTSIFICLFLSQYAQNITLSFSALDSDTQEPLTLDSLIVLNLDENCDTTLYDPVSGLVLDSVWHVGIAEPISDRSGSLLVSQNVPNPFRGTTTVNIYLENDDAINLAVFDLQGRNLSDYRGNLKRGWHHFSVASNSNKMLFLRVSDRASAKTVKMLCSGSGAGENTISYAGPSGREENLIKSSPLEPGFIFFLGDSLRFTAYVDAYYKGVLYDDPISSESYVFSMVEADLAEVTTDSATNITSGTAVSGGNVISDGGAPVTARGVCYSLFANPSTAGYHTTDGSGTGPFVSYLLGLVPGSIYHIRAYATNSVGTEYGDDLTFVTLPWACGDSITKTHVAGAVAPVDKTTTYGTVDNIPGEPTKCWITSNLGSDHQATAVNDATEASAGWYWRFNRLQGFKHDGQTVIPTWTPWGSIEYLDWLPANDPCLHELGSGWRIPTSIELYNIDDAGWWTDWNMPWNSDLKLHAAGMLEWQFGDLYYRGEAGEIWSSTATTDWEFAYALWFWQNTCYVEEATEKGFGQSVRCIRE